MACSAHRFHVPPQPAPDHHHVIPRAWQKLHAASVGLQVRAVDGLWDRRTVELCPSCHRGVHERIVAQMHGKPKGRDRLSAIANLALERFVDAGGSLDALKTAGLYGEQ